MDGNKDNGISAMDGNKDNGISAMDGNKDNPQSIIRSGRKNPIADQSEGYESLDKNQITGLLCICFRKKIKMVYRVVIENRSDPNLPGRIDPEIFA
jgi:hypothetical protein